MAVTPWRNAWETRFPSLRDEMDKLFEDFFGRSGCTPAPEAGWIPAADIHETKKDVVVTMEMPAVNPKELSISIVEDRLTVKGEKKNEDEVREDDYYRCERTYGSFQRTIQLPAEVVGDKAKATYKDGVLKIVVPKSERAMPKEIKIEVQ
jgi:HSP20 family protein